MRADNHPDGGFTLIELVVVILVISFGLIGLAPLFTTSATTLTTNEIVQQAAQYAQECAERAMATRRNLTFAWFDTNQFSCGTDPGGFTRSVTLTPSFAAVPNYYTGGVATACPNGVHCRDVVITATSTVNPSLSSSVTVMLVDY